VELVVEVKDQMVLVVHLQQVLPTLAVEVVEVQILVHLVLSK
tara:strand:+ start:335 stop:460 length:126 start_codon:yes stop_codon:yes gene_type:complete